MRRLFHLRCGLGAVCSFFGGGGGRRGQTQSVMYQVRPVLTL
eukprot:COSAG02_NODE_41308_length_396_cov_0.538721_1_plen_41_part_10